MVSVTLLFGIDDNRNVVGLTDAQADAEAISRLIKERISPYPNFILVPERECDCSKFRPESAHIERHEPNL